MIKLEVKPESLSALETYMLETQERILKGLRLGMQEGMAGLATLAASLAPVKTGALAAAILQSPRVTETQRVIRGTVSAEVGGLHVGLWQEFGIDEPAVTEFIAFDVQGGDTVFSQGHAAFKVPGHPFMNRALESYKGPLIELMTARMREAMP